MFGFLLGWIAINAGILLPAGSSISESSALKVSNLLPEEVENCFLDQVQMYYPNKYVCLSFCKSVPSCLLACTVEKSCRIYSATVSPNWTGMDGSNPKLLGGKCYSFWANWKDLAHDSTLTSSLWRASQPIAGAKDGFGCYKFNSHKLFLEEVIKPWLRIDLGSSTMVDRVIIQTRGDITPTNPQFEEIEVRVGDIAGTGDFSGNELLMSYRGSSTNYGHIVTFKRERALQGRFVSVQRMTATNKFMIFMELKIIPP